MNRITIGGVVATALYAVAIGWYLTTSGHDIRELELNEFGDFLAGVLGPLAFFWLICGYLQQGIELKQNTRALELQVSELQNSVEQQKALVEVTRDHAYLEMDEIKRLRDQAHRAAQPFFTAADPGGSFHGDGTANIKLTIANIGADVYNVGFSTPFKTPESIRYLRFPAIKIWGREKSCVVTWSVLGFEFPEPFAFTVSYVDSLGNPGVVNFAITCKRNRESADVRFKTIVDFKNFI